MSQNELQRVVAEMLSYKDLTPEQVEWARRIKAESDRIEAAQAVAPGGGEVAGEVVTGGGVLVPRDLVKDYLSSAYQYGRNGFHFNTGEQADRFIAAMLAAAPASEPLRGSSTQFDLTDPKPASEANGHDEHCDFMAFSTGNPECTCKPAASSAAGKFQADNTRFVEALPRKLAEQEQAGEDGGVHGLAAKIGLRYAADESCEPGVAFYAFTESELDTFAAALLRRAARVDVRPQYEQLIYAVGSKFPGETRHQTALRYINEREAAGNDAAESAALEPKE